ncbi:MAG: HDOD domain-containing protein [Proteobacteria bacterium]|nr:HDOD domain-containing protein [Pseudomonadota bacterium]
MTTAREVLRTAKGLPTLPTVVAHLASLLNDDSAGAAQFERVIKPDPAITANLLRLVNSAYFGVNREVTSVRQAIAFLGIKQVFEVAASASFKQILPNKIPGYEIDSTSFWKHSVAVAAMSERLVQATGNKSPDLMFTAGLLHDIGKLAIGSLIVKESEEIHNHMWRDNTSFVAAENEALGTDHTEVGELMAEEWNLPQAVEWATRWHHHPDEAPDEADQELVDLVHVADGMAHAFGFGADVGELKRTMKDGPMERLGLKVQDLELTACETTSQIHEMGEIFSKDHGGQR